MNKEKQTKQVHLRPYEKFMQFGAEYLTESELLAVILRTGSKDADAERLAEQILEMASYGRQGLLGLHRISMERLLQIKGVGRVKAIQIKCVLELCTRMAKAKAEEQLTFNRSGSVAAYYMETLRHRDRECVLLLMLDTKGRLIKETELSKGTVKSSLLSPREVFVEALQASAVNIILLHNHPSGDPTPSREDMEITAVIAELGQKLDIPLIDHIIIGDNRYISFKEKGYL
ncbi:MAG: DNA repair protein RadC [Lachnospiraceae bacterium]|nr:DNA repair protein RadC [Lachnospiraceae bacterium]MBQ7781290.1 DNA repair protein RadC [Lachnospiraceae bacterium]